MVGVERRRGRAEGVARMWDWSCGICGKLWNSRENIELLLARRVRHMCLWQPPMWLIVVSILFRYESRRQECGWQRFCGLIIRWSCERALQRFFRMVIRAK